MLNKKNISLYIALFFLLWFLTAFAIYPAISIFINSITVQGNISLDNYKQIISSKNLSSAFFNTILLSFSTILICAFIGCSLALSIHAVKVPFRKIWHVIAMLPMVIPGIVVVVAYVFLYGGRGFIGLPLRTVLGIPLNSYPLSGFGGILFIHAFTQYIYFYLLTTEAIEKINMSQIEAAKSLGCGKFRIFFEIVLPSFAPYLTGASVLTFLTASGSFSAPIIVGGDFRVMSTEIFFNKQVGYINLASTQAVMLSLFIVIIVFIIRNLELKYFMGKDFKGSDIPFKPIKNDILKKIALLYIIIISIIIILPIFAVILISFGKSGTWLNAFHSQYTFDNYIEIFGKRRNIMPIYNSVITSFISTISSTIIGIFVSYVIVRTKIKGRAILESVCMIPWLLPSSIILISLISAYNIPNILVLNFAFIGSYWFMPLAFTIIRLPIIVRSASSSLIAIPKTIEEASRSLGANSLTTFFKVVLPSVFTGISFSITITFIFIMGEYAVPTFSAVSSNVPITMALLGAIFNQKIELGMAYGSCLIIISVIFISIFSLFTIKNRK